MQKGVILLAFGIIVSILTALIVNANKLKILQSPKVSDLIFKSTNNEKLTGWYCRSFGPANCPKQYCELSGPSCPICLDVGGCIPKGFSFLKPVPTSNIGYIPTGTKGTINNQEFFVETLAKGDNAPAVDGNYLINNQKEWDELWNKVSFSEKKMPGIDFSKETVIAVSIKASSSGYDIEVSEVKNLENSYQVVVKEISPGQGCITLQVITSPFHIVKTNKIKGEVVFQEVKEIKDCPR